MKEIYLEVTYYAGEPLAAYLYLPRHEGDRSIQVKKHGPGLAVDLAEDGRPIGIEMTNPTSASVEQVNEILESYGVDPSEEGKLAPLKQAA
jgi:uncharacterized protein YuzE